MFQAIIDTLPTNIKLVLCGSFITIMKELLEQDNPLFGRFSEIIHLQEMDYLEAQLFYPDRSVRDKIALYSIFGGSPYVLAQLAGKSSIATYIKNLVIPDNSILRSHIENVALSEIRKTFDIRILEYLGNGKKKYSEIEAFVGSDKTGLLDKQLKHLISMETIKKISPINKRNDKRKQFYSISDNLMRFYFTYIFAHEDIAVRLGEEAFYKTYIENTLNNFISFRFEEITLQFFSKKAQLGQAEDVLDIGSYWYDDKKNKTNGEFDCVLKTNEGYKVYEVKYLKNPMTKHECLNEVEQVEQINDLQITSIGFICSSGFNFDSDEFTLISGEDLYSLE